MKRIRALAALLAIAIPGCGGDDNVAPPPADPRPVCSGQGAGRTDLVQPASAVADWGPPVRLGPPVNTPCPQDAIAISPDGAWLYVLYTEDVLENMTPAQILARHNNTYRLPRLGGPGEFGEPEYYELGLGAGGSLDGELSWSPDGAQVWFHSARASNLGWQQVPPTDDFLDIYVADISGGRPGPARNPGPPVNSIHPDGEHALHPDGQTLYLASLRPGGWGQADIYVSRLAAGVWSEPVNLGPSINSIFQDYQPTFTADGETMYFASGRNPLIGMAIYRSRREGGGWGAPELVIRGLVGEPALTADGRLLYFVHVLSDAQGRYDADVWYCERVSAPRAGSGLPRR